MMTQQQTSQHLTQLTDNRGASLGYDLSEPNPGSIVLTSGIHGTAWQRHFRDGWWYCTGRVGSVDWGWLTQQRNLVLVYDAPERD